MIPGVCAVEGTYGSYKDKTGRFVLTLNHAENEDVEPEIKALKTDRFEFLSASGGSTYWSVTYFFAVTRVGAIATKAWHEASKKALYEKYVSVHPEVDPRISVWDKSTSTTWLLNLSVPTLLDATKLTAMGANSSARIVAPGYDFVGRAVSHTMYTNDNNFLRRRLANVGRDPSSLSRVSGLCSSFKIPFAAPVCGRGTVKTLGSYVLWGRPKQIAALEKYVAAKHVLGYNYKGTSHFWAVTPWTSIPTPPTPVTLVKPASPISGPGPVQTLSPSQSTSGSAATPSGTSVTSFDDVITL